MKHHDCNHWSAHPYRGGIADTNALVQVLTELGHDVEIFHFRLYQVDFSQEKHSLAVKKSKGIDIERCIDSIGPSSWRKTAKAITNVTLTCCFSLLDSILAMSGNDYTHDQYQMCNHR